MRGSTIFLTMIVALTGYLIVWSLEDFDITWGPYGLSLGEMTNRKYANAYPSDKVLRFNIGQGAKLEYYGAYEEFTFYAREGHVIDVSLSGSGAEATVFLLDPSNDVIFEETRVTGRNSTYGFGSHTVETTGVYRLFVEASSIYEGTEGLEGNENFRVKVERLKFAETLWSQVWE